MGFVWDGVLGEVGDGCLSTDTQARVPERAEHDDGVLVVGYCKHCMHPFWAEVHYSRIRPVFRICPWCESEWDMEMDGRCSKPRSFNELETYMMKAARGM